MSIGLIVEDGTGIVNSNSVVSDTEIAAYAEARGISGVTPEMACVSAIKAMDVLMGYGDQYVGVKAHTNNFLPFPRTDNPNYTDTEIPQTFKQAQLELSYQSLRGLSLENETSDSFVTERTVGPLTRKFQQRDIALNSDNLNRYGDKLSSLLSPLLKSCESSGGLTLLSCRG